MSVIFQHEQIITRLATRTCSYENVHSDYCSSFCMPNLCFIAACCTLKYASIMPNGAVPPVTLDKTMTPTKRISRQCRFQNRSTFTPISNLSRLPESSCISFNNVWKCITKTTTNKKFACYVLLIFCVKHDVRI